MKAIEAVLWLTLGLGVACHSSDSDSTTGDPGPVAGVDVVVSGNPRFDLATFEVEISELRLIQPGGAQTPDLLRGPRGVEIQGLAGQARWVTRVLLAAREYTGVLVKFDGLRTRAVDTSGAEVAILALDEEVRFDFDPAFELTQVQGGILDITLDLGASLEGDPGSGSLLFDPAGKARWRTALSVEPLVARFGSYEALLGVAFVDPLPAEGESTALGSLTLAPAASSYFDAALNSLDLADWLPLATDALVEFHCDLVVGSGAEILGPLGLIRSARILPPGSVAFQARVKALDGAELTLEVHDVERGAAVLSSAESVVAFNDDTRFVLNRSVDVEAAVLRLGQEVLVRIDDLAGSPPIASIVDVLEHDPAFAYEILEVSGEPPVLSIQRSPSATALAGGSRGVLPPTILRTDADTVLELRVGSELYRDALLEPLVGQRILFAGASPPDTGGDPLPLAARIEIVAARILGEPMSVVSADERFALRVETIEGPLALPNEAGPVLQVRLADEVRIGGDVRTSAELLQRLASASPSESLRAEVWGTSTGNADEVLAFEVVLVSRTD